MLDSCGSDPFLVRTVRPDDTSGVLRLLRNGWFKRAIWRWQFSRVGEIAASGSPVVAERNGRIVGFNGLMPVRVATERGVLPAGWSCDFIVHDRLRRAGLGRDLKKALDGQCPLILAKGTSPAAARVLPRCGWREGVGPTQHVVHLRFDEWRGYASALLRLVRRCASLLAPRDADDRYAFTWTNDLPDASALDAMWARHADGYRRVVVRDSSYLLWRYDQAPGVEYTYLMAERAGHPHAMLVFRQDADAVRLIDYVGPCRDAALKAAAIGETRRRFPEARQLSVTTNDAEFRRIFERLGSLPARSGPAGFFVRDVHGALDEPAAGWYLMDGDSDGEFLSAARSEGPTIALEPMTDAQFAACRDDWEALRETGTKDPLFMSWDWQSAWWKYFSAAYGLTANFVRAVASDGRTVAIVPMVCWDAQARRFLPTRRLQLIGHLFQGPAAMRTEYLDFLIEPDWEVPVIAELAAWLRRQRGWDEYIVQDAPRSSAAISDLVSRMSDQCYLRDLSEPGLDETRFVRTDRDFAAYLRCLSANMRRSLYHGRKRLAAQGDVTLRDVTTEDIDGGLDLLNELHARRWGRPVFTDERLDFHRAIARSAARHGTLRLSVLEVDGQPVSILYDLLAGRRRYNLQQGFDPALLGSKGSLGIIHFGYVIEACCDDPEVDHYDLLAGAGKQELYKTRMDTEAVSLNSVQLIRGLSRKLVYRLHDWIR